MSKEVYLSNLEWTKTHDNIGGVIGNVVFKDNISYEEYEKLLDTVYYILTKKDEIETLTKRNKEIYEGFMATTEELCETTKEVERLNNIIKIMEKYFELIIDLGYDYDGLNNEESLKKLIDELCRYASLGRAYNTTEVIYVNGDKNYNILNEELKGVDKA